MRIIWSTDELELTFLCRHMEDGCSKRFDIGTLDVRAENGNSLGPSKRSGQAKMGSMAPTSSSNLTSSLSLAPTTTVSAAPGIMVGGTGGAGLETAWGAAH